MSTLVALNAAICTVICLRLIFYRRRGSTFRPLASILAYVIIIAAAAVVHDAITGAAPPTSPAVTILLAVLCLALLASRGNVVEIFHTAQAENCIYKIIRRTHHA